MFQSTSTYKLVFGLKISVCLDTIALNSSKQVAMDQFNY